MSARKSPSDFTDDEKQAIRARRQHQNTAELAFVFGTSRQAIVAICREGC